MKKKSLVMMLVSLGLVGTIMVGATFAYFTSSTKAVTNTFTVGANVGIELLEDVTQDAGKTGYITDYEVDSTTQKMIVSADDATSTVEFKDMYPGLLLNKKPFVQKSVDTSDCYVRVKVSGIDEMITAGFTITINKAAGQWVPISTDTVGGLDGVYQYETKLTGTDKTPNLFESVQLNTTANAATEVPADGINIKAYAIQADGFVATATKTAATIAFETTDGAALLNN